MFEPIREDLEKVESEFYRHVESQVDLIPKIGRYIQNGGGKRIRPAVLLMAARLTGYTGELAVLYAAVVEFIHTATLVHDDIIDDSQWRRGQPSVHSRWGSDVTVLLGDYLYIKSMGLALTPDRLDIVRQLCDVTLQDDRRGALPAFQKGRRRDQRGRASRHRPSQDGVSVRRVRSNRRHSGRSHARTGARARAVRHQPGHVIPAHRRSCSTSQATRWRSANRLAGIFAKAKSPFRSSGCCSMPISTSST